MDKLPPLSSEKNKPLTRKSFLDALTKFETAYQNICGRENGKEDEQGGKEYVEGVYSISPDALKSYFDSLNDAGVEILNPEEAAMVKVLEAASKYMNVYSLPNYELMDPELEISCLDQSDKAAVGEETKAREENNFKKVRYWSDVANRVDLMKRLSQGDEISYDDEKKIRPNLENVDYLLAMLGSDGRVRSIDGIATASSLHELSNNFKMQADIITILLHLASEKK